MDYLDLTLPTPAENLALDEALLEEAEEAVQPAEVLRLWEPASPMVVVGRSSRAWEEVRLEACRAMDIPVLRRPSGGAAVVGGPGCLMYALVLSYERRPALRRLDRAHGFVLQTMAQALRAVAPGVECQGTSDLAVGKALLKFSGNSVRCRRRHFLYHGTLLCGFPLGLIERCLAMPPREPAYRAGRPHGAFVTNLPAAPEAVRIALRIAWGADTPMTRWPRDRVARLVAAKYGRAEWNHEGREPG